jgi:hypothetical protein
MLGQNVQENSNIYEYVHQGQRSNAELHEKSEGTLDWGGKSRTCSDAGIHAASSAAAPRDDTACVAGEGGGLAEFEGTAVVRIPVVEVGSRDGDDCSGGCRDPRKNKRQPAASRPQRGRCPDSRRRIFWKELGESARARLGGGGVAAAVAAPGRFAPGRDSGGDRSPRTRAPPAAARRRCVCALSAWRESPGTLRSPSVLDDSCRLVSSVVLLLGWTVVAQAWWRSRPYSNHVQYRKRCD